MTPVTLLQRTIQLRTDPRPPAIARVIAAIAALLASLEAARMLSRVLRPTVVKIPFVSWVPLLPAGALPIFLAVWVVAALLFALGWKTWLAGTGLVLVTGYTLVLDEQTYSNHLYLLCLVILLLTISGSGLVWSLDARRHAMADVAAWPVLLLKIEATIVYFFSAMAKLTPSYLAGEILSRSLKQEGWLALPVSWRTPAVMSLLAVGSIVAELFVAFGLWSRRSRPFAIAAGTGFHLLIIATLDSSRLSLAIFALAMFAIYPLFVGAKFSRMRQEAVPG
jgi:hypothetical protein